MNEYTTRDFANEVRLGAWQTADDTPILDEEESWFDAHERSEAQYEVEHGHAAFMLDCGHALPLAEVNRERRRYGPEKWCGICQAYVKAAR